MAQYLPLPDGSSLKLREGETPAEGWARAQRAYPDAFAAAKPAEQPESGFIPATKAGISSLKADVAGLLGRAGAIDIPTAEKYRQEQEEYQRRVFKPTEKGWTEAPGTKVAELLGGSLPYMAAPLVVGAGAATLPVSAPVATAVGIGGAGLTSALQFTGSNISRQVEEGKRLAETDLAAAGAAALPQAALDMVSFRMMPGVRRLFMQAGKEIPETAAKKIAEQGVKDVAKDYAVATGRTMGVEGLTEAGQQVFERLQAGLNIADPAARSEYFDSFLGGAILGGAIAPAGRFIERGGEKKKQELEAQQAKAAEQRRLQEEADRQRAAELGAPLLTGEEAERPLFVDEKGQAAKFTDLAERERLQAEKEQAKLDAQATYKEITKSINDLREQAQTASPKQAINLGREAQRLEKLKEDLEKRVADKADPLYRTKLVGFEQLTQEQAEAKLTTYDALQQKIKQAQAQFDKAKDQGDVVAQGKAAEKLQGLKEQIRGETPDLFGLEGQKQIAERAQAEAEAVDLVTLVNLRNLVEQKRQMRQERRDPAQDAELKRLEFGLERMGLGVLGVKGEERVKTEVDLSKGIINPTMAEKLGIYEDQFSALQDRLAKAATPEEKASVQEQIDALDAQAKETARAVDVLPAIETAYEKALAKQKETADALVQEDTTLKMFDEKGQLTEQGKLAVANEAILRQLAELRRLGRESKETLEAQRAEDLFAAAPTRSEAREEDRTEAFGKAVAKAGEEATGEPELTPSVTYTSRNEAFEDFSDAAYKLQRGEFLGRRTGVTVPEAERKRAETLQAKIDRTEEDLRFLRGQGRAKRQQSPAIEKRVGQLEGRLKTLKAGLSETKASRVTTRKLLIGKAERAANYLINNAITEIKADRVARGLGEMTEAESRNLEESLRKEFDTFIGRVSAAERVTGEVEKKPVGFKMVDGKLTVVERTRAKAPPIQRRPYEKLQVALKTLRSELEATVTEAKGRPAKGEFEAEPVEKVAKPVEKPVKTTKKKIAERAKAAKHEDKKKQAIAAGKQTISDNQKQIRALQESIRLTGAEVARLKKAAVKDKNPQMRMAKVERLLNQMDVMREDIRNLKETNKGLAIALRTLGVETGRVPSGAYILDMIENDQNLKVEELAEAGLGEQTVARVEQLQQIRSQQEAKVNQIQRDIDALERRNKLLTLFPAVGNAEKITKLRKDLEFNKRLLNQAKSDVNKTQREIFVFLGRGTGKQAKQGIVTSKFSFYEVTLAAKFLQSRIDQVLARMETAKKSVNEADRLIKAQLGTIVTPKGETLPGIRVTTEMEWSPRAVNELAKEEREKASRELADANAARDAIRDRLKAEGKPIRGNADYEAAATVARSKARILKGIKDFEYGYVPIRTKREIFASKADTKEVLGERQRQTADFVQDKPLDAEEIATELRAMLTEKVREAEKDLANIPSTDKAAIKRAKTALTRARNRLAGASIYEIRSKFSEADLEPETKENALDSTFEEELRFGTYSDADIIASIDYRSDEIDPRFGEAPTDLIDEAEAKARLKEVKAKANAQDIEFEYYDSVADLPKDIKEQMARQGMDTVASQLKGGVYKGRVFVIVQNHNNMVDLEQTLAHELVGHYSIDGLLGRDGLIELSKSIDKTPGGLDKLAKDLGLTDVVNGVFLDTVRYYKKAFDEGKITEGQIRANAKIKAMREMIAYTMEKEVTATRMEKLGYWYKALVGAVRAALRKMGVKVDISTSDLFYLMKQAKQNFEAGKPVAYRNADNTISFRREEEAPRTGVASIIAPRDKAFDTLKANLNGLNFRVQFLDRLAGLEALVKKGMDVGLIDSLKAMDVMYFNRKADQRNNFTAQFVTNGVGKIAKINGEFQYVGGQGPNMRDVADAVNESGVPDGEVEFSAYVVALRAKDVGIDKLDFTGKKLTQKDVDAIIAKYSGTDKASVAFQKANKLYQQYNNNLIDFAVSGGAMSKELGEKLKKMNYIPYYRKRGGIAELVVFGEQTIRIGDMKNQPYLDELVGGKEDILPIFTGAVQNTQLLVDMTLKNMATRNTAFALGQMGLLDVTEKQAAKGATGIHKGMGPADPNVIRFKIDGNDMWARVNIEAKKDIFGDIPTDLVVKGLEGIKATLPFGIRMLGIPANILRKLITRDPRYAVRQIFRDSLAATLTTGANFVPVAQTLKDMATMKKGEAYRKLQESGSLGGQVISGATDDMDKILQQISSGKTGWTMAMAKLDDFAMMGDAATRVSMYNSFIKQGLSEREADFATMEAMNFSRRGLSPSVLYANTLIPFFNAGVQGIDVLYRAFRGQMPYNERLQVQRKLLARGATIAAMTMFYAAAMEDDETYKNANVDERYNNWFVPTPLGTLRVPIPFEAGFIFKGIPEGVYRMAFTDDKNSDVLTALKDLAMRSVPIDLPAAVKPAVELMLNRSFFTDREIVDQSMSEIAKYQFRPNTPETIKLFGEIGLSPAKVEYFIKGYTGSLPLALISAMETVTGIRSMDKEKPAMRIYETPIVGGLFQPPDASGMINRAYETVNRVQGAKATYNRLVDTDPREASEFLKENMKDIQIAQPAGWFRQQMGDITSYERYIRESRSLSADEKRERLDKTKQMKINLSEQFSKMSSQIERQAAR